MRAGPTDKEENQTREKQRCHGHPRDWIRGGTDLASETRGNGDEKEAKCDNEKRAKQIALQVQLRRGDHDQEKYDHTPDNHLH